MQAGMAVNDTDQEQGNIMNSNHSPGNNRKDKSMNFISKAMSVAVLVTLGLTLAAGAAEPPAAELKVTHDWPSYYGPDGTYADPSKVPLLEDLGQAKLLWISEHDRLGHSKTSSGFTHSYGPKSRAAGSADLIVAGGLVIVGYFDPKNNVVADDIILALDALTGQTKWKQVYAGQGYNRTTGKHTEYGPCPVAADGKVFHLGSGGRLYGVELATGKPLWDCDLGKYPEQYKAAVAKVPVTDDDKKGVGVGIPLFDPLTVIGGVLMVTVHGDGLLYAFDTSTGKELWRIKGIARTPNPITIGNAVYALCSGGDDLRLVEPKSGKVLWTEKIGTIKCVPPFISGDGKAFIPVVNEKSAGKAVLAAFAIRETGAKLLWQSKRYVCGEAVVGAYRDGVVYCTFWNGNEKDSPCIMAYKAEDGAILQDYTPEESLAGWSACRFHLWGDRLVRIGDDCHESIGHHCYYRMITMGPKQWRLSGHMLPLRGIRQYVGVGGYDAMWMRPAFADGLVFTRSVNRTNGKGAILCWDLRARPHSTWVKFCVTEPARGLPGASNYGEAQVEVEGGKVTGVFMELPTRSTTANVLERGFARGLPRQMVPLTAGRWKAEVDVEIDRDSELWSFDLDTTTAAPSGTYQRIITALAKPTAVGGASEAKQETLPNGVTRWMVNLKQAVSRDPDLPPDQRRDMYIVIDRAQGGEQDSWARARLLNTATHEVHLTEFTPGEKALTLKGTVLFHSDAHVPPSSQRPGVVAMDVEMTLDRDGEGWKGTYKGVYGSQWTGNGRIVGPK
jgi:outer membrane protein assembly factor BamB